MRFSSLHIHCVLTPMCDDATGVRKIAVCVCDRPRPTTVDDDTEVVMLLIKVDDVRQDIFRHCDLTLVPRNY